MLRLTGKQNVEILCLYRPFGFIVTEGIVESIRFICRDSQMQTLTDDVEAQISKLYLFVLTPQQYVEFLENNKDFIERISDLHIFGFVLVEDPMAQPTLKLRKKIAKFNKNVIADIRFPYTQDELLSEFYGSIRQIYLSFRDVSLTQQMENIFDSFIEASVGAIESRDLSTKGHSERVALLTVALAEAVGQVKTGKYASLEFNKIQMKELKYAALLHDFGKIGVRESVLTKEKKLYDHELQRIKDRFSLLEKKFYIDLLEKYLQNLMQKNELPRAYDIEKLKREAKAFTEKLSQYYQVIEDVNEPDIVGLDTFARIAEIASGQLLIQDKQEILLLPQEVERLSIQRGSLSNAERREIESHVVHSYNFLVHIPWSENLKGIPEIVRNHHERLNGSGYPRKLQGEEICVRSRMMAIADIYDALVARDRPYKKAMSHEQALTILEGEVHRGSLDDELFNIFVRFEIGDLIKKTPAEILAYINAA